MSNHEEKKGSEAIKNIIEKVIGKIAESNISKQEKIQRVWEKILEEEGFRSARVAGLKDNQITILVDSSARLYEMNLRKRSVLTKIKKEIPEIENIYFKIGRVK